jgi:hypothetical protein
MIVIYTQEKGADCLICAVMLAEKLKARYYLFKTFTRAVFRGRLGKSVTFMTRPSNIRRIK